jgi:hypothetical protein
MAIEYIYKKNIILLIFGIILIFSGIIIYNNNSSELKFVPITTCSIDSIDNFILKDNLFISASKETNPIFSGWIAKPELMMVPKNTEIILLNNFSGSYIKLSNFKSTSRPDVSTFYNKNNLLDKSGYLVSGNNEIKGGVYKIYVLADFDGFMGLCFTGKEIKILE